MYIFNEYSQVTSVESIHVPTLAEYFWVLDLSIFDYTLTQLAMLEELECPTLDISIENFTFPLPAHWYILIADPETSQLDAIKVHDITVGTFHVVCNNMKTNKVKLRNAKAIDYSPSYANVYPSIQSNQMICHAIGPNTCIHVSSYDTYGKYINGLLVGDLI
jgi:hypothetical protein